MLDRVMWCEVMNMAASDRIAGRGAVAKGWRTCVRVNDNEDLKKRMWCCKIEDRLTIEGQRSDDAGCLADPALAHVEAARERRMGHTTLTSFHHNGQFSCLLLRCRRVDFGLSL